MHKNPALNLVYMLWYKKSPSLKLSNKVKKCILLVKQYFATVRYRNFSGKATYSFTWQINKCWQRACHYFPQKYPKFFVGIAQSSESEYGTDLVQLSLRIVTPDSHPTPRWCISRVCYNVLQELKYMQNLTGIFHLRNHVGVFCYIKK